MTTIKHVLLTCGDQDLGILPFAIAMKEGRRIATETGLPVRLRDVTTDKILMSIKPNGAAR